MADERPSKRGTMIITGAIVVLGAILASGILLLGAAGADSEDVTTEEAPAHVELVDGSDIARVTLTQRAAERVDLQLATSTQRVIQGQQRLVIPYAALLYDADGTSWTYTSPEPLTFERVKVAVDFIDGDYVVLSSGPVAGTSVVIVGAQELFGAEFGVGH